VTGDPEIAQLVAAIDAQASTAEKKAKIAELVES